MQNPHAIPQFPRLLAPFDLRTTPLLRTDVLVLGSGIAGACAALHAADAGAQVLLLAKDELVDTNTAWAQGGIAVVKLPEDSVSSHVTDTLRVGAGIATPQVVREVVNAAASAVDWLQRIGARFDRHHGDPNGALELSREGGHSHARVVHSHGDATGQEIQRAIAAALLSHPRITVKPHVFVRDLVLVEGRCVGAIGMQEGMEVAVEAGAVVIATGGTGQIYRETTNPTGASGDGHALCFRAGARMADCEFVQFHPTTLYIAGASRFLISEVVRGAGAVLRDRNGERFMDGVHPMRELAPRDVVSRAILDRMVATNDTHVYLDLTSIVGDPRTLFPSIARICSTFDLDLAKDPIPVRPGAHYFVGGAATDTHGRTTVPGLLAVGEAAATGLHGANRLASNSLLEGSVIGHAAGLAAAPRRTSTTRTAAHRPGPAARERPAASAARRSALLAQEPHVAPGRAAPRRGRPRRREGAHRLLAPLPAQGAAARPHALRAREHAHGRGARRRGGPRARGVARHALPRRSPRARRRELLPTDLPAARRGWFDPHRARPDARADRSEEAVRNDATDPQQGHSTEAILFGLVPMGDPRTAAEALHELQLLAETADFVVGGCMVQHRRHADPHSYLGSGKLDELAEGREARAQAPRSSATIR
jgi:L-aspartate oxidase